MYGNKLTNVNEDLLAGAANMAQLDMSDNELTDGSLAFVPAGTGSYLAIT